MEDELPACLTLFVTGFSRLRDLVPRGSIFRPIERGVAVIPFPGSRISVDFLSKQAVVDGLRDLISAVFPNGEPVSTLGARRL